ncbi:hypothetical protein BJ085DRAFT_31290 [Dimargaris cristalligena]|uniref:Uncharacterized protein n=1 Tax=Dimargaris cristalligena TaxID=215637 RepID=A0A4P9ZZM5_9FUNG|nr:hypothetical protein BJ085DRAFT_31290 [Dimargaris cristalligena]|eukprot:RKP38402.1 hypothetical protein BJ085DRAFT_31290 [Dimargaris cristalligena]
MTDSGHPNLSYSQGSAGSGKPPTFHALLQSPSTYYHHLPSPKKPGLALLHEPHAIVSPIPATAAVVVMGRDGASHACSSPDLPSPRPHRLCDSQGSLQSDGTVYDPLGLEEMGHPSPSSPTHNNHSTASTKGMAAASWSTIKRKVTQKFSLRRLRQPSESDWERRVNHWIQQEEDAVAAETAGQQDSPSPLVPPPTVSMASATGTGMGSNGSVPLLCTAPQPLRPTVGGGIPLGSGGVSHRSFSPESIVNVQVCSSDCDQPDYYQGLTYIGSLRRAPTDQLRVLNPPTVSASPSSDSLAQAGEIGVAGGKLAVGPSVSKGTPKARNRLLSFDGSKYRIPTMSIQNRSLAQSGWGLARIRSPKTSTAANIPTTSTSATATTTTSVADSTASSRTTVVGLPTTGRTPSPANSANTPFAVFQRDRAQYAEEGVDITAKLGGLLPADVNPHHSPTDEAYLSWTTYGTASMDDELRERFLALCPEAKLPQSRRSLSIADNTANSAVDRWMDGMDDNNGGSDVSVATTAAASHASVAPSVGTGMGMGAAHSTSTSGPTKLLHQVEELTTQIMSRMRGASQLKKSTSGYSKSHKTPAPTISTSAPWPIQPSDTEFPTAYAISPATATLPNGVPLVPIEQAALGLSQASLPLPTSPGAPPSSPREGMFIQVGPSGPPVAVKARSDASQNTEMVATTPVVSTLAETPGVQSGRPASGQVLPPYLSEPHLPIAKRMQKAMTMDILDGNRSLPLNLREFAPSSPITKPFRSPQLKPSPVMPPKSAYRLVTPIQRPISPEESTTTPTTTTSVSVATAKNVPVAMGFSSLLKNPMESLPPTSTSTITNREIGNGNEQEGEGEGQASASSSTFGVRTRASLERPPLPPSLGMVPRRATEPIYRTPLVSSDTIPPPQLLTLSRQQFEVSRPQIWTLSRSSQPCMTNSATHSVTEAEVRSGADMEASILSDGELVSDLAGLNLTNLCMDPLENLAGEGTSEEEDMAVEKFGGLLSHLSRSYASLPLASPQPSVMAQKPHLDQTHDDTNESGMLDTADLNASVMEHRETSSSEEYDRGVGVEDQPMSPSAESAGPLYLANPSRGSRSFVPAATATVPLAPAGSPSTVTEVPCGNQKSPSPVNADGGVSLHPPPGSTATSPSTHEWMSHPEFRALVQDLAKSIYQSALTSARQRLAEGQSIHRLSIDELGFSAAQGPDSSSIASPREEKRDSVVTEKEEDDEIVEKLLNMTTPKREKLESLTQSLADSEPEESVEYPSAPSLAEVVAEPASIQASECAHRTSVVSIEAHPVTSPTADTEVLCETEKSVEAAELDVEATGTISVTILAETLSTESPVEENHDSSDEGAVLTVVTDLLPHPMEQSTRPISAVQPAAVLASMPGPPARQSGGTFGPNRNSADLSIRASLPAPARLSSQFKERIRRSAYRSSFMLARLHYQISAPQQPPRRRQFASQRRSRRDSVHPTAAPPRLSTAGLPTPTAEPKMAIVGSSNNGWDSSDTGFPEPPLINSNSGEDESEDGGDVSPTLGNQRTHRLRSSIRLSSIRHPAHYQPNPSFTIGDDDNDDDDDDDDENENDTEEWGVRDRISEFERKHSDMDTPTNQKPLQDQDRAAHRVSALNALILKDAVRRSIQALRECTPGWDSTGSPPRGSWNARMSNNPNVAAAYQRLAGPATANGSSSSTGDVRSSSISHHYHHYRQSKAAPRLTLPFKLIDNDAEFEMLGQMLQQAELLATANGGTMDSDWLEPSDLNDYQIPAYISDVFHESIVADSLSSLRREFQGQRY